MTGLLFFSPPLVFSDSLLEVLTLVALVSAFVTVYKHIECHQDKCHRLGRFAHGHYKLCHVHKPGVPSDGKIGPEHIAAETARMEGLVPPHD